jgi:signal transduction histidine kinase
MGTLFGGAGPWFLGWIGTIALAVAGWQRSVRLTRAASALGRNFQEARDQAQRSAEAERRTRRLVEAQPDFMVRRDANGRITFANAAYARLAGAPTAALMGAADRLKVAEAGPIRTRPDGVRLIDEAVATGEGLRWIAWTETDLVEPEGAREVLRIGREITDRVVSERALADARIKAEAASEAKSRFLATVSHEFRTPLNGILGMADLMLDTPLSPEQATYVQAVRTSGQALLSLVDEILDFSRIEAGRLTLSVEPFDLHALIEGVVELLAPPAQGKGIEIAAYVAPDVPRRVLGDEDRLRQILVNLAGNAVKFTDAGGVGITVECGTAGEIVLAVGDTGPGIAPERVSALFEEFERGDDGASGRHGGTGLGLAITRRIVERMQGAITVESAVGQGSTFRVRLPLPDAGSADPRSASMLAGERVLIVARSPFEAPYLTRRLAAAGATAEYVETVPEALVRLGAAPFGAMIVDVGLGDAVRQLAEEAGRLGVKRRLVLLSPFDRRAFGPPRAAGFEAYLVKPVRSRSLFEQIAGAPRCPSEPMRAGPRRAPGGTPRRVLLA